MEEPIDDLDKFDGILEEKSPLKEPSPVIEKPKLEDETIVHPDVYEEDNKTEPYNDMMSGDDI